MPRITMHMIRRMPWRRRQLASSWCVHSFYANTSHGTAVCADNPRVKTTEPLQLPSSSPRPCTSIRRATYHMHLSDSQDPYIFVLLHHSHIIPNSRICGTCICAHGPTTTPYACHASASAPDRSSVQRGMSLTPSGLRIVTTLLPKAIASLLVDTSPIGSASADP